MTTATDTTSPAPATTEAKKARKPRAQKKAAKAKGRKSKQARKASGDEESDDKRASVVPRKYKARYAKTHDSNGDGIAEAMREHTTDEHGDTDVEAILKVGKQNGIDAAKRWGHLRNRDGSVNVGMIRMNLGNCLRGLHRQGIDIKIGTKAIKGQKQVEQKKAA